MTTPVRLFASGLLLAMALTGRLAGAEGAGQGSAEGIEFFEKRIRPLLIEQCYKCHSADSKKLKGELRMDHLAGLLEGGSSGQPSLVPGKPEESLLIKAVRYGDPDLQMPPKEKLPEPAIADLVRWVGMGAPYPAEAPPAAAGNAAPAPSADLWSFKPLRADPPPAVARQDWAQTDIDRHLLAQLEAQGLEPVGQAEPRALVRRATFDLTGLPPTPAELDAFLADTAPDAWSRLIERLLASPAYGERWGRHWLDVVRYADTAGESADYPIPQAHLYRDWVIDAFNRDQPYDQFVAEQLAGDLMPAADERVRRERTVATGFIALSRRFGVNPEHQMHLTIEDTIDTMGRSLLGLSLSCARCHDHKFDPIPATDYYALYGIFASTRYPFPGSENKRKQDDLVDLVPEALIDQLLAPYRGPIALIDAELSRLEDEKKAIEKSDREHKERKRAHDERIAKAKAEAERAIAEGRPAPESPSEPAPTYPTHRGWQEVQDDLQAARKRRDALLAAVPAIPRAYAVADAAGQDVRLHKRGEPGKPGDVVPRGFLSVLGGQRLPEGTSGSGRLQLAGWITDRGNPLTARVMVNRIWQHHFGRGLVRTASDFGSRGSPPTHPALLDHLARSFIDGGWSVKAMHRAIMSSRAYRMASHEHAANAAIDPGNDHFWRFNRRRLQAEEVRDAMLAVSGRLDRAPAGPHPFPAPHKWDWTQHNAFSALYDHQKRSVYLMQQRIKRHPFFEVFDGADPSTTTAERLVTSSPLQALFMMNDRFVHAQATAFAQRLDGAAGDDRERLAMAYRLALGRPAASDELDQGVAFLQRYRERQQALPKPEAAGPALAGYARALFSSNEFMFLD